MYIYDLDFSSCHPTAVTMFRNESEAPILHKSLRDDNLYLDIAKNLKQQFYELQVLEHPLLRKIIKKTCLAMFNGGGMSNLDHFESIFSKKFLLKSDEFNFYSKFLAGILSQLPILREFYEQARWMYSEKHVYIPSHSTKSIAREQLHKLNTMVLCSV